MSRKEVSPIHHTATTGNRPANECHAPLKEKRNYGATTGYKKPEKCYAPVKSTGVTIVGKQGCAKKLELDYPAAEKEDTSSDAEKNAL
jgi:hypothetical protein